MSTVKSESKSVISKASTASTALDLLLQRGLQITPEGRCVRHPEVVMLSKDHGNGSIISCEKCSKEHQQLEDGSSGKQEGAAAGNDNHNNEDEDSCIVSISKLAVSSVPGSLDDTSSNKTSAENGTGAAAADNSSNESDNMEALIARWCQLQDMNATSSPSDVLSTTLILLQLQKLERRVSTQEKCIQDLEHAVKQQHVAIRGDLTEILTFMATAANRSSRPARSYSTPVSSIARRSRQSDEEELDTSGPTQDSGMDASGLDASAKSYNYQIHGRSQKSLLHTRDRQFHPSTAFPSARTMERQPPKPPRRHDSARSVPSIATNSVPSVAEMKRQESGDSIPNRWNNNRRGRPPVMQSSLSNSTISTSTSSRSINLSHWQMPYGSTTVKSNAELTTSTGLTASSTATPTSASATAPSTGKRAIPVPPPVRPNLGQNPFKAKNSFRNKPAGSQLEIIWDASEHTAAQTNSTTTGDTTPKSLMVADLAPPSRVGGILGGESKIPQNSLPTLVSNLDDDDDEESLFGQPSKLFSGMGNYMSKAATAAAGVNAAHHDSYMTTTSGFSFMGDDGEDDINDLLAGKSDNGKSDGKSEGRSEALSKSCASSGPPSDNFTSTDGSGSSVSDDSEDETPLGNDKSSSKEKKKEKKLKKKEQKRLKKERKKAEKEKKKQDKIEKKLSSESAHDDGPDDRKPKSKGRRFSTNILWNRGSKGSDKDKARAVLSAEQVLTTSTEAMTSTEGDNENSQSVDTEPVTKSKPVIEFSVVNDNPLPDAAEKKGRVEEKSPAMPSQPTTRYSFVSDNPLSHSRPVENSSPDETSRRHKSPVMPQRQISKPAMQSTRTMQNPSMEFAVDIKVEPPEGCTISSDDLPDLLPAGGISTSDLPDLKPVDFVPPESHHHDETGDDYTTKTPMTARTPNIAFSEPVHEPPPPPNHGQNRMQQLWHHQRRVAAAANAARNNAFHPPSPPPRNRGPFPRAQQQLNMMPTIPGHSRREILIPQTGESQRMQISTLTLDTALPSADTGTLLCEVTNQSLVDKINERGTYTGTINELDEPEGVGTMIYNNGAFYKGQWKEGHWYVSSQ